MAARGKPGGKGEGSRSSPLSLMVPELFIQRVARFFFSLSFFDSGWVGSTEKVWVGGNELCRQLFCSFGILNRHENGLPAR